jgi:hypothetical protein
LHKTKSGIRAHVHVIALFCVALYGTAWANRTIELNNIANECGGTLYVSGSGWAEKGQLRISATNTPGSTGTHEIAVGPVKNGKFSITIPYSYEVGSPAARVRLGFGIGSVGSDHRNRPKGNRA